ncbi:MAG: ABC transporter substrate-binding protein [Anaerolineae bacterium]
MRALPGLLTRRHFLAVAGGSLAGAATLAACGATPTPQIVEKVVTQVVKETQIVEKEVTTIVEGTPQVVKETVVVEKAVEVTPTAAPEVKITAHFTFSPTYKPRIEGWTAAFQEHYPHIKVELIFEPWGEWQTKILTLAAAGQTTELLAVHMGRAQVLAQQGALLAVDDWLAADPDFDLPDFYPASLVMFQSANKLYGFPWDWGTGILAYNKDMFDAAGVAYPTEDWTFDDLLVAAQQLTKPETGEWGYFGLPDSWGGLSHLGPWGGGWVTEDETACMADTPESIEALQWWANLRLEHNVHPMPADEQILTALGVQMLATGKIGMVQSYPWDAGEVKAQTNSKWDVATWPKGPKTRVSSGAGSGYAIGKDTKHPEEAWLYIRWFASKEGQAFLWGDTGASIPARESAIQAFLGAPDMPEHASLWVDGLKQYSVLSRPISAPANEFHTIASRELDLIYLGEKSVEEGAKAICTDASPILAQNKAG